MQLRHRIEEVGDEPCAGEDGGAGDLGGCDAVRQRASEGTHKYVKRGGRWWEIIESSGRRGSQRHAKLRMRRANL